MKRTPIILAVAALVAAAAPAQAQLGRVIREGAKAVGKKAAGTTAREGIQEGAELAARKGIQVLARETAQESAEAIVARAGLRLSDDAVRAVGSHGSSIAVPLVRQFGDDGARALSKLSPGNARRMAIMADDLAAGGHGADFMKVVAKNGDVAADWLWRNKGSVFVGSAAAAFLASPDTFLNAGEAVATKAIESAGENVAQPLIKETAQHVAPAVVKEVMAPVMSEMAKPLARLAMLLGCTLIGGSALLACAAWCWYVRPWLKARSVV